MSGGDASSSRAGAVLMAASPGGHMALLRAVAGAVADRRRVWVTAASSQADALREEGEDVRLLPLWARDRRGLRGAAGNLAGSGRIAHEVRPAAVVTSGAGHVVPVALAARALRARLVFVETMARVGDASLTGRILAPLAARVVVQWPESASVYPGAVVCRPALLDPAANDRAAPGRGTFVSVGTRPEPFDRLLGLVDRAVQAGVLPQPVVAQAGASRYRPSSYSTVPWLAPDAVQRAIEDSRYVVCHAGSAIVAAAVAAGRRPLVLARLPSRGEHRTRHQPQVLELLARRGLVVPLGEQITAEDIRAADAPAPGEAGAHERLPSVESVIRGEVLRAG